MPPIRFWHSAGCVSYKPERRCRDARSSSPTSPARVRPLTLDCRFVQGAFLAAFRQGICHSRTEVISMKIGRRAEPRELP
jgi:hypothetical protein